MHILHKYIFRRVRNIFRKSNDSPFVKSGCNVPADRELNIIMEITLRCNSTCPQCSRHCNVFSYGDSDMTLAQIDKFISQVFSSGVKLGHILIMGGEPTVHPDFVKIVTMLYEKLYIPGKVKILHIYTNGIIPIQEPITDMPVEIFTSPPSSKHHRCQYIAPCDTGQEVKICDNPTVCGIALNAFGFFPCGAGGSIVRLFELKNLIRYYIPSCVEEFGDISGLCSLCQASAVNQKMYAVDDCTPSKNFQRAIEKYKLKRPSYKRF